MTDYETEQVWNRVAKTVYADSCTASDEQYNKWAESYDDDLRILEYSLPSELVDLSLLYIDNKETSNLLDVGAGTGLCGVIFKEKGYKGQMDALEINDAMMKKAESKRIYRKHIKCGVYPDKPLPVDVVFYDTVVCVGSLIPNHIEPGGVVPMARVLKLGGCLIFNTRNTEQNREYKAQLDKVLGNLVEAGQLEEKEKKEVTHFHSKCRETGGVIYSEVYVYKKVRHI